MPRRLVLWTALLTLALLAAADGRVAGQSSTIAVPGQQVPLPGPAPGTVGGQVPGAPMPPARDRRPGENERGTAVIRGQVVAADSGVPLRRVIVRAFSPSGNGMAQTDAEGRFAITELPAGRYNVSASRSGYVGAQFGQKSPNQPGTPIELAEGQTLEKVGFSLVRGGAIVGRIMDDLGEPLAGAEVRVQRYAYMGGARRLTGAGSDGGFDRTDDLGQFRLHGLAPGDYYIVASYRQMETFGPTGLAVQGQSEGYAPTYFPGTPSVAEARRITVRAGQDAPNASFALVSARVGRISGRVTNSAGEPYSDGTMMVAPRSDEVGGMSMTGTQIRPDGTFQTPGLPPGTYTLIVQPRGAFGGTPTGEVARLDVPVNGDDVADLLIVTGRPGVIRGRVISDDGAPLPFKPSQLRLFAQTVDPTRPMMGMMRPSTVRDDWTFELSGLVDDIRLAGGVEVPGLSWSFRHAWKDNVDLLDAPVPIGPGQTIDGVDVVVTSKVTALSGLISDGRNQPVTDASVVVFSEDRQRWIVGGRYIRLTRPDTNGKYEIRLTPAANYRVVVVRGLEAGQSSDPEFLTRAIEVATAFDIGEGEAKVLNLRLAEVK